MPNMRQSAFLLASRRKPDQVRCLLSIAAPVLGMRYGQYRHRKTCAGTGPLLLAPPGRPHTETSISGDYAQSSLTYAASYYRLTCRMKAKLLLEKIIRFSY